MIAVATTTLTAATGAKVEVALSATTDGVITMALIRTEAVTGRRGIVGIDAAGYDVWDTVYSGGEQSVVAVATDVDDLGVEAFMAAHGYSLPWGAVWNDHHAA